MPVALPYGSYAQAAESLAAATTITRCECSSPPDVRQTEDSTDPIHVMQDQRQAQMTHEASGSASMMGSPQIGWILPEDGDVEVDDLEVDDQEQDQL